MPSCPACETEHSGRSCIRRPQQHMKIKLAMGCCDVCARGRASIEELRKLRIVYFSSAGQRMSLRQLAQASGIPDHGYVGRYLRAWGLTPLIERGRPPKPYDADRSYCSKCGAVVPNNEFPLVRGSACGDRLSYCRSCRRAQSRGEYGRTPEKYFHGKQKGITNRYTVPKSNRTVQEVALPDGYLAGLWYAQDGRCFYTDRPMRLSLGEGRHPDGASVDRVDNDRGYVPGNVVLCRHKINLVKRDCTLDEVTEWMPDWGRRINGTLPQLVASVIVRPYVSGVVYEEWPGDF